ncbi:uncharacterized protein LOC110977820 [Acanthaster planci]|uniref:Uncharacterized protein LOC110977820 n=1 Tax=Acanthaster planci TaxID=133434 RepID=A0A8B7Y892_ACAPL|nr:uncharacterized protein LOC110977820 [Acanthaster planci]
MAAPATSRRSGYSRPVKLLGIVQVVTSGLSAVLGIASALAGSILGIAFSGMWTAMMFFLPAGILGVMSVTVPVTSRRRVAVACLVMTTLSSVVAAANIGIYAASIAYDYKVFGMFYYFRRPTVPVVLDAVSLLVNLAELTISIILAVYCRFVISEYHSKISTIQCPGQGDPTQDMHGHLAVPFPTVASSTQMVGQSTNQPLRCGVSAVDADGTNGNEKENDMDLA